MLYAQIPFISVQRHPDSDFIALTDEFRKKNCFFSRPIFSLVLQTALLPSSEVLEPGVVQVSQPSDSAQCVRSSPVCIELNNILKPVILFFISASCCTPNTLIPIRFSSTV